MKKLLSLLLALALCAGLGVPAIAAAGFSDVAADSPFAPAIAWAVEQGVTKGTTPTTFGPGNTCTTSHILTFLWRAAGRPGDAGEERAAVSAWAAGLGVDVSDLGAPCTRAAAVTDIWKAQGSPAASEAASFTDVDPSAPYAGAVSWAVEAGVTNGTGGGAFSPEAVCTRGQIVTFLYRALAGSEAVETPSVDSGTSVSHNGTTSNSSNTPVGTTTKDVTEDEALAAIQNLLKEYPDGMTWNDKTSRTGTPSYASRTIGDRAFTSMYIACGGFASLVSDTIFGSDMINPARKVPVEQVRPGDFVILFDANGNSKHVAIAASRITGIDEYGDGKSPVLTVYDGNCAGKIRYDTYYRVPKTYSEYHGYYVEIWTRYPTDNATPWSGSSNSSSPSTPTDSSNSGSSAGPGTASSSYDELQALMAAPCGLCGKLGGGNIINDAQTKKVCADCANHNRAAAMAYLNS